MKNRILIVTLMAAFFISCKNENVSSRITEKDIIAAKELAKKTGNYAKVKFNKEVHDFGTLNEGESVTTTFEVTNTGEADLVIIDAKGSCGCTVPEYKKEPIKPGETAEMKVTFNSEGKPGKADKTVTLTTNTEQGTETCKITANVLPKKR